MPNLAEAAKTKTKEEIRMTVLLPVELQEPFKQLIALEERTGSKQVVFLIRQALAEKGIKPL